MPGVEGSKEEDSKGRQGWTDDKRSGVHQEGWASPSGKGATGKWKAKNGERRECTWVCQALL